MLSKRIAILRKHHNMSQKELAKKLNISPSAIGMYEQGRRMPSIDTLVTLANILNVSLDYLLTGNNHIGSTAAFPRCPCDSCYWSKSEM